MKPVSNKGHPARAVEREWLDHLPPEDERALRSRKDLVRINWFMRNPTILARALNTIAPSAPWRLVEIGAGDGALMSSTLSRLDPDRRPQSVTLVDRLPAVKASIRSQIGRAGCEVEVAQSDVFDWLREALPDSSVVMANLFLHHFQDAQLRELFQLAGRRAEALIACEPQRSGPAIRWAGPMMRIIGCNHVTRHDGVLSVQAGFAEHELSALWPEHASWEIEERPAGLFSHFFSARRAPEGRD